MYVYVDGCAFTLLLFSKSTNTPLFAYTHTKCYCLLLAMPLYMNDASIEAVPMKAIS